MVDNEQNLLARLAIGLSITGVMLPLLIMIAAVALVHPSALQLWSQLALAAFVGSEIIALVAGAFAWRSLFGKAALVMAALLLAVVVGLFTLMA